MWTRSNHVHVWPVMSHHTELDARPSPASKEGLDQNEGKHPQSPAATSSHSTRPTPHEMSDKLSGSYYPWICPALSPVLDVVKGRSGREQNRQQIPLGGASRQFQNLTDKSQHFRHHADSVRPRRGLEVLL